MLYFGAHGKFTSVIEQLVWIVDLNISFAVLSTESCLVNLYFENL